MRLKLLHSFLLLILTIMFGTTGCRKDTAEICSEQTTIAGFRVNGFEFNSLQQITWLRSDMVNSLLFMQAQPNGDQHVVNVIFVGDTIGTYPLLGINAPNRASYFAPGVNGTTFPDTVIPGILVITDFEEEPACLSGHSSFEIDTLEISGEFQSLRPD